MTRVRWADIERVLDEVLDHEPHEWNAAIAELCGPDAELRAEVESLVARHEAAQRFLQVPAPAAIRMWRDGPEHDASSIETREPLPADESHVVDPLVGSSVAHYRIVARLGGGGMGVVYRARDTRLERDVALKFLPPHLVLDARAKSRFMVEARAAAALDHSNICTVHEIGETGDGRLFIAMACYDGQVLKERIAEGALPPDEAVTIAIGIARGLAAAHARGIVHRDVKPANVMLAADGGVKLLDFGIAKLADVTVTQSGVTPGTVAYMSPEQIHGAAADARSDLWSLGVVLHEMVTGTRPFLGSHDAAVMHAILHDDPPALVGESGGIMANLSEILGRLLARNPDERYPSASALLAELEPLAADDWRGAVSGPVRALARESTAQALAAAQRSRGMRSSVRRIGLRRWMTVLLTSLVLAAAGWVAASRFATGPADVRRVAVLPLANLTGDPALGYFVDGVHYALTTELSRIEGLAVQSRQSVLRYRGSDRPLPEIARELGVDALVEGAVFKSGDSVRITVQLLRARPEQQMLAATHTGPLDHALVLHNVVAHQIADSVHARLAPAEARRRQGARHVVIPAAEKAFLAGLYHLERSMKAELLPGPVQLQMLDSAIRHFEDAIALDPRWSAPHARLSTAYRVKTDDLPEDSAAKYYRKAKVEAARAIELDDADAEAHASLAIVLAFHEWDWAGADREIRRSLALDPYARAFAAAAIMTALGRHDETLSLWRKAEARYPLSELLRLSAVMSHGCAERNDEAIATARELNDRVTRSGRTGVSGDSAWLLAVLAREHSMKGEHAKAIAAAEALAARQPTPQSRVMLAFVYARAGRRDEARAIAARLEAEAHASGRGSGPAHLYAALGDTQRAVDIVVAAAKQHRPSAMFRCSIEYRVLRNEPRMRELVRTLGFPSA
ncbi:MAG TPA: protein kinase [Gemmatimonadaceae bacterium]|nr:protein kinase [Gemmatimonadaceae bacterium]